MQMFNVLVASTQSTLTADLLKTGAGVAFGFVLGIIAEPIKVMIKTRMDIRNAKKLIIEEINLLADQSKGLLPAYDYPHIFKAGPYARFTFRLERYSHLKTSQPSTLLRLKGYDQIRTFFEAISRVHERDLTTNEAANLLFRFLALREDITSARLPRSFNVLLTESPFAELIDKINARMKYLENRQNFEQKL
jgi:hypothetical protein